MAILQGPYKCHSLHIYLLGYRGSQRSCVRDVESGMGEIRECSIVYAAFASVVVS